VTSPGVAGSAPAPSDKRTSYLELFFDLVFVFAITQIVGELHTDHTTQGWARAALVLWLIWWAWSQFTWAGTAIDLERRGVRLAMLAVTGLALLVGVAIPDAFAADGAWFAVPYALVRFAGLGLQWFGLRHDPAARAALASYTPIALVGPVVVLAGGLLPVEWRLPVWAVAVLVDVLSVIAAGRGEFRVAPGHFAERHALITIIALGESIIAVGATADGLEPSLRIVGVAAVGFAIIAAMWWLYFDRTQRWEEERLVLERDGVRQGRLARDLYTLGHLPVIAGTVVFAAGVEEVVLHPDEPMDAFTRWAVGAGLALFLAGLALGELRARAVLPTARIAAAVTVPLVVVLAGPTLPSPATLGLVAMALALTATAESRRGTDASASAAEA
jgi:low temperature requirement protein LtrA